MGKKIKIISLSVGGFIGLIVVFISVMTWFYPYSIFSVDKSYAYEPEQYLYNGKEYEEILSEFKDSYQKDLEADMDNKSANLIIDRTQYILPIFEQEWLVSKSSVPIDETKLDTMLMEVKNARVLLLDLIVQVDLTGEQRDDLVHVIKNFSSLEDSITKLKNEDYASRKELNRQLDSLHSLFIFNFRTYIHFYDFYGRTT